MNSCQYLKPSDFMEKSLGKGLFLFIGPDEPPCCVWVQGFNTDFLKEIKVRKYREVVYVLREGQQKLLDAVSGLGLNLRGRALDREPYTVRVYGSGKLQLRKDEEKASATASAPAKIKVLIVDDSSTMRSLLERCIGDLGPFEVVASSGEPEKVKRLILEHKPDVMTLDLHMPVMNGVELLQSLGPAERIPAVLVSSLSMEEGSLVIQGLEVGAFDYIKKPVATEIAKFGAELGEKLQLASESFKRKSRGRRNVKPEVLKPVDKIDDRLLVAIGASTGGTEAIREVISRWPREVPPIVIVQHIPPYFSKAFADRLNELCEFEVKEAEDGDEVRPGRALVAPGGFQMTLAGQPGRYRVEVKEGDLVSGHKPSVDHLFHSVARVAKDQAVGLILTGMGKDGAKGMLEMKKQGAYTFGQDEASSVVYGMPKAAYQLGAVAEQLPLEDLAENMLRQFSRSPLKKRA